MPPLPSEVWKHFRKSADKSTASCLLCSATIQLHGGTSNLRNHIKFKQPSVDNNKASPDVAKQQTLHQVYGPRLASSEAINQALANFVVQAYVPMKIVEHESFRHLMQLLNPQYEVPSRTTVRARIDQQYDDAKKSLLSSLQGSTSVALTTDSWTSNATEAYLTVTVHYIKDDWSMESRILMIRAMPERHTGENLAIRLKDCVDEFGLKGRVEACVHDNARNIDLAIV